MATNYSVDGKAGKSGGVFRDTKSGRFEAKVMSGSAYKSASDKANTAIRQATKTPKR